MKKIYVLLVVGASFMMSACSDFLDREPLTTPNSETFLSNASAVNNSIASPDEDRDISCPASYI